MKICKSFNDQTTEIDSIEHLEMYQVLSLVILSVLVI